jgi:hypothetical protein
VKSFLLTTVTILVTTSSLAGQSKQRNPLTNLSVMTLPQAEIPIGAEWIPGIGPNGTATTGDNITITKGLSASTLSSTTKNEIGVSLAAFLGLSGQESRELKADYTNLAVYRVKSISALKGIKAGQTVLMSGITADVIKVSAKRSLSAKISTAASAKGLPVNAVVDSGDTETLSIDGSNLFIAYSLVRINPAKPTVIQKSFANKNSATIGNLRFVLDGENYISCACGKNAGACAKQTNVRVEVANLASPNLDGSLEMRTIEFNPIIDNEREFSLGEFRQGSRFTISRASFRYHPRKSLGGGICLIDFQKEFNLVRLTNIEYAMSPFVDKRAPF